MVSLGIFIQHFNLPQTDRKTDRQTERQTERKTDRKDRQTDKKQTDRQKNRQKRQTNRPTNRQRLLIDYNLFVNTEFSPVNVYQYTIKIPNTFRGFKIPKQTNKPVLQNSCKTSKRQAVDCSN